MRAGGDLGGRPEEVGAIQPNSRKSKRVTLQRASPPPFPYIGQRPLVKSEGRGPGLTHLSAAFLRLYPKIYYFSA